MPRKSDLDALADFITEAQRRIRNITNANEYTHAVWWVSGAPEYPRLPDAVVEDLLEQMEAKRLDVIRASGALAG